MKKRVIPFLALVFLMPLFASCRNSTATEIIDPNVDMRVREIAAAEGEEISRIVDEARSAVVSVYVEIPGGYAIGSGVAIREGGYILTNYHVIEDAESIELFYADKTTGTASLVWGDSGLDLAIIKSSKNIPYLSTLSSDNIMVGEDVYALGTPLTLQFKHTVTKGIVSAKERTLEVDSDNGTSFLQSLIQHDASINAGNSGGALINSKGQVIGINTLKATEGEGLGFAIPIEIGDAVMNQIIANEGYREPYLGVFGFDSDIAELYGQKVARKGVYVVNVDGPAKKAGLQKADIIINLNGENIENILDLRIALFSLTSTENISLSYIRNDKAYSISLNLDLR